MNPFINQWPEPLGRRQSPASGGELPFGVVLRDLEPHSDERGVFTEIHRDAWRPGEPRVQWNAVRSRANVLRGVHVHRLHEDQLTVLDGVMLLGLHDVRSDSPTAGLGVVIELRGDAPQAVVIPVGVAHGFFFPEACVHIYAVSRYFDPHDELGCRFDSPELGLKWPIASPHLSERDANAGSYSEMVAGFAATTERKSAAGR